MDIVGPLPRSRSGNQYILVICDYATRYPEAVPLRRTDAQHVAEELVKLFSRVGIPTEILTDQGSNFTSKLLSEVYNLLHIRPIRTSPYHPQTDGLVERFNQTLKAMLRKTAVKGKDWDKLLPYLLFAYREVPQASTGFSPFELLYGRAVRGPMDVLRESWEAKEESEESVVSHVLQMQERLSGMTDLVQENLGRAQKVQKTWYDGNARLREFKPGDSVLVLLPTSTSKLLAQWQGPYQVTRRLGNLNYEVDMHDRQKQRRIFHVNMLRRWHQPPHTSYVAEEVVKEEYDDEDIPLWDGGESDSHPVINSELSEVRKEELHKLLNEFTDVLRDEPGRTTIAEHSLETGSASPIRQQPYRVPHAYRETVRRELEQMEAEGIIEQSSSEWASPIVLVKKKDDSLRLCVDYRKLNALTPGDAYPMPRIDDLIDKLGKAKYITTLDLTRGYWQVPLKQGARRKSAFVTPFGLYQFRVMPFGLSGAPATFQRMMDNLTRGLSESTGAYLDDLVIYSSTWNDHFQHVREVLSRLREAGLTAKPRKCQFGMSKCAYLGHVVGNGRVTPDPSKLEAIQAFPTPTTKKQVRAFLGLAGYYRRFIQDFSSVSTPLSDLTRKSAPEKVVWSTQCEKAFAELKRRLCSEPVLQSPDFDRPFVVQTDASDRGIGAVLSQKDVDGLDHPVAYFSKKLLPREEKYAIIEKECLAIKLAVEAFSIYLLGRHFVIQTDHRSLEWLDRLKASNAKLTRWSLALQPYHFTVEHRPGAQNNNADALSRAF